MSECQVCGGKLGKLAFPYITCFNSNNFSYRECSACGSIGVDPLPEGADFDLMYSQENYHDNHYSQLNLDTYRKSLAKVQNYISNKKGGTLLDFGCGNGGFMLAAKEFGFDCIGVEFADSTIVNASKISACEVLNFERLERCGLKFDVIHIGHVLEHILDPAPSVIKLLGFLKPNGFLFIEGPLEKNPSLVRFVVVAIGRIKSIINPHAIARHIPYHLTMTTRQSQMYFFVERLNLNCDFFSIEDTGGAYFHGNPRTIAGLAKRLISLLSITLSRLFPQLGDVFVAILRPSKQ